MGFQDYIKLIRPPNAIMVTAMTLTGMFFANPGEEFYKYLLALVVALTYTGIAMVHNDIIDLSIDLINAPSRPIPSGRVSLRHAKYYVVILFVVGTVAGLGANYQSIIIMLSSLVLSLLYNAKLKKMGFIGNLTVGFTATSAFLYGDAVVAGWTHMWPLAAWNHTIYLYLISAMLNTSREVAKGIMDVTGDSKYQVRTIAVLYGEKTAAKFVLALIVLAISICIPPVINRTFGPIFILAAVSFIILLLRQGIPLFRDPNYTTAKKFKTWLLPNMFIALLLVIIDELLQKGIIKF